MTLSAQLKYSKTPKGRTILHLICLSKDHRMSWHIKGIIREIKGVLL